VIDKTIYHLKIYTDSS